MSAPKFKIPGKNSMRRELRKRTNEYFKSIGHGPTGNAELFIKAGIIVASFLAIYVHLVFFNSGNTYLNIFLCTLLGFLAAAVGFNIMHDGAHGSFSTKKWLNELAGMSLNFLGANVFMWKTKHNTVHHTYTNIDGVDDDLNARPMLRLCPDQKRLGIHKYQHLYFAGAYSLLYIYWVLVTDLKKYFQGHVGGIPIPKMSIKEHLIFWGFKVFFGYAFIVLPISKVGVSSWTAGFLIFGMVTGLVISIVFQLAHVVEETEFPKVNEQTGTTDDEWVIHQLKTTINFSPKNLLVRWFTGGLNYQVEHHLFPNISHIHYPAISKIVEDLCKEYEVPYLSHYHFSSAVKSHIKHLKNLGQAA
ncbi:MAG: linoleoyl-CoA desaturase [Saprospiraceae bacterium]|jgi:linoleoyl-CoA desaturase